MMLWLVAMLHRVESYNTQRSQQGQSKGKVVDCVAEQALRASSATEAVAASALASALEGFKRLRITTDVVEAAGRASEHLQLFVGCRRYYTC